MKRTIVLILFFALLLGIYLGLSTYRTRIQNNAISQNKNIVKAPSSKISFVSFNDSSKTIQVIYDNGATSTIPRDTPEGVQEVKVVDINFDDVDDIQVTEYAGAYNTITYFLVYDSARKVYEEYRAFRQALHLADDDTYPGLGYVQFDSGSRVITSFFKGRGLGDLYEEETFSFVDGVWQLIKTETQDLLNYPTSSKETQYYIHTKTVFVDNATTSHSVIYLKPKDGDISNLVEVPLKEVKKAGLVK
jgi:hypothetical protein